MIKVSIIVPTYRSGAGLDRVIRSLERQTMPATEFEVIFVDDGSPDDTVERLEAIRTSHANVSVRRIEHSGWPSRPRNIGLEMAVGEYVLFMDHDDELYPDALRAGYALASRNGADVLNGKESRTDQPKWAIEIYTENIDNAVGRRDVHPILPTNPHKLFRRRFLLQHGIRFPEGQRVLWEDVFFNVEVFRHAQVISVLSDTPFYHWVRQGQTASSGYGKDPREYWSWLYRIFEFTSSQLADDFHAAALKQLILNQYRTRVLPAIGADFFAHTDADIAIALEFIGRILTEYVPEAYDDLMPKALAARAYLARRGQFGLLAELARVDAGSVGLGTAVDVDWVDGKLEITSTTRWRAEGAKPLSLVAWGGRIFRDLPVELIDALPDSLIDVTEEVSEARSVIGIRSRRDKVTWMLPTRSEVNIDVGEDGAAEVSVTARATLDIQNAAFGQRLESVLWDFNARNELLGALNQRGLRTKVRSRVALIDGRSAVAYTSKAGILSLDVGQNVRSIINSALPEFSLATSKRRWGNRFTVRIPLRDVTVAGTTRLGGELRAGAFPSTTARIIGDAEGARLEGTVRAGPGEHRLSARFEGREVRTQIVAKVSPAGKLSFTKARSDLD